MTKAKVAPRRPAVAEPVEADISVPLSTRAWAPVLIVAVVVAAVLGMGLLVDKALEPQVPAALAGCQTSTQIAPREFIGPQPLCITATGKYEATVNTTQGPVVIRLHPEVAPVTVNNFIVLAIHGYYNGLKFWDSQDWEVQTGDPLGNGRGGPGYSLPDEPGSTPWGIGAVGMARVPGGSVNGSQFFIEKGAWPDPGPTAVYNRFGTVISGLDKVQLIQTTDTITSITIKVS
ncbi:MAG TPA: peptidylprolyl isomerase [Candidatus Acidoferrum sp.]|nr:peptidylprolyl isomerase [Candidatus Acidoferrum sp.]